MNLSKEDYLLEKQKLDDTVKEVNRQLDEIGVKVTDESESLKEFQRLRWEIDQELDKGERYSFVQENDLRINILNEQTLKGQR